jgi:hypothetical protein
VCGRGRLQAVLAMGWVQEMRSEAIGAEGAWLVEGCTKCVSRGGVQDVLG